MLVLFQGDRPIDVLKLDANGPFQVAQGISGVDIGSTPQGTILPPHIPA